MLVYKTSPGTGRSGSKTVIYMDLLVHLVTSHLGPCLVPHVIDRCTRTKSTCLGSKEPTLSPSTPNPALHDTFHPSLCRSLQYGLRFSSTSSDRIGLDNGMWWTPSGTISVSLDQHALHLRKLLSYQSPETAGFDVPTSIL